MKWNRREGVRPKFQWARWIYFWLVVGLIVLLWTYMQGVNRRIRSHSMEITRFYVEIYGYWLMDQDRRAEIPQKLIQVIQERDIPCIIVDQEGNPVQWVNIYHSGRLFGRGTEILPADRSSEAKIILHEHIESFKEQNSPLLLVNRRNRRETRTIYFGNPDYLRGIHWLPAAELLMVVALLAALYIGLRGRQSAQEGNLWVAFAKETAHQLGTPISSLLGWSEMMKIELSKPPLTEAVAERLRYVVGEVEDDVVKLNKIALRFSQIGAPPTMAVGDLNGLIKETIAYFKERLPLSGKQIQIITDYGKIPPVGFNRDLMEWVIENLLKNSVDAMTREEGVIDIQTAYLENENTVKLSHTDNAAGIEGKNVKKIFEAGFSTKKRGWGLGLALCRRIVEEFHGGKIYVESTLPGRGTTMVVRLPAHPAEVVEA